VWAQVLARLGKGGKKGECDGKSAKGGNKGGKTLLTGKKVLGGGNVRRGIVGHTCLLGRERKEPGMTLRIGGCGTMKGL